MGMEVILHSPDGKHKHYPRVVANCECNYAAWGPTPWRPSDGSASLRLELTRYILGEILVIVTKSSACLFQIPVYLDTV